MERLLSIVLLFIVISTPVLSQKSWIKVADDIDVLKLSDNVYLHRSYFQTKSFGKVGANGLILVNNRMALMIDTPWNNIQTEKLFYWVRDSLSVNIGFLIVTHWHDDRMGGLDFLNQKGIRSYSNQQTIDIARLKNLPLPQNGFSDSLKIDFENIPVECFYWGGGHTSDNIIVWLPTEDILFGGCCIKDLNSTGLGNLLDADTKSWDNTIHKIKNRFGRTKIIIPGHGDIGGCELIDYTIRLLKVFNSEK